MAERQQRLAAIVLRGPGRGQPVLVHRGRRPERHAQFRPAADQPEAPRRSARTRASAIIRRIQAATANVPGIRLYMQPVQDLTIDTAVRPTQYQVILENPNLEATSTPGCRASCEALGRNRRCSRTWPATSRAAGSRPTSPSTAPRPAATASLRPPSTTPSTTPSASASSRRSSPSRTSTASSSRPTRTSTGPCDSLEQHLPAVLDRDHRAGAALGDGAGERAARAAADQPSRPVPGHHRLVQPRPRRGSGPGGRRDRAREA